TPAVLASATWANGCDDPFGAGIVARHVTEPRSPRNADSSTDDGAQIVRASRRDSRVPARPNRADHDRRRPDRTDRPRTGVALVERRQADRRDGELRGAALPIPRLRADRDPDGRRDGDRRRPG